MKYKWKLTEDDRCIHKIEDRDLDRLEQKMKSFWRRKFK